MRLRNLLTIVACIIVLTTFLPWILVVKISSESHSTTGSKDGVGPARHYSNRGSQIGVGTKDYNDKRPREPLIKSINETDGSLVYHFVVNTDCATFQRWQVLTQIHSARSVQQSGRFTWIVSGCPKDGEKRDKDVLTMGEIIQDLDSHFSIKSQSSSVQKGLIIPNVHFSPDFSDMTVYGGPYADGTKKRTFLNRHGKLQHSNYGNHYHFNNKPNGLRHWALEYYGGDNKSRLEENEAVVLIDPDFLFLSKFQLPSDSLAVPGRPVAAAYGLGSQWLDFNRTAICGENSPCTRVVRQDVANHYTVGPPYIIHARDVVKLSKQWSAFVPPTYDQYPLLYAEMYAYSMAAAHLEMPHKLLNGLYTGCMVGWPRLTATSTPGPSAKAFVDAGSDRKTISYDGAKSCFLPPLIPPPFLHYCRRYAYPNPESTPSSSDTYYFLAKRRVPHDILDCKAHQKDLQVFPSDEQEKIIEHNENWTALTACSILRAVNYARKQHCSQ